jgi:hypothetical protein
LAAGEDPAAAWHFSRHSRSRELRLATQRAAKAEQARQQALKEQQEAAEQVAALQGRLLRRDLQGARDRRHRIDPGAAAGRGAPP